MNKKELKDYAEELVKAGVDSERIAHVLSSLTHTELQSVLIAASNALPSHLSRFDNHQHLEKEKEKEKSQLGGQTYISSWIAPNQTLSLENVQEKLERSKQMIGMLGMMTQVYIEKRKENLSPPVRSLLDLVINVINLLKPFISHPLMLNAELCSLITCTIYSMKQWSLYPLVYASLMALIVAFISFSLLASMKASSGGLNLRSIATLSIRTLAVIQVERNYPSNFLKAVIAIHLIKGISSLISTHLQEMEQKEGEVDEDEEADKQKEKSKQNELDKNQNQNQNQKPNSTKSRL